MGLEVTLGEVQKKPLTNEGKIINYYSLTQA